MTWCGADTTPYRPTLHLGQFTPYGRFDGPDTSHIQQTDLDDTMATGETTAAVPVILLVEDRKDDVLLITRAFETVDFKCRLIVAESGEEALFYLSGHGKFSDRAAYPLPGLILLDLKKPGIDGFEVLTWIRHHPQLSGLRVVVLTSSDEIRDANEAYKLGANSFLVKPLDFENFTATSRVLRDYWLRMDKGPQIAMPPSTTASDSKAQP